MNIQGLFRLLGKQSCRNRLQLPLEPAKVLWVNAGRQLSAPGYFSRLRSVHLHFLYEPSCKTAHPFPPSHKGGEASLWKLQPKSPSVYAEPDDLDTMQMNSVLIWMLPEMGGGGGREWPVCTGLFLCAPPPPPVPTPSVAASHSPAPCPLAKQPRLLLLILFWPLESNLVLVHPLACLPSDSFSWNLTVLSEWEEMTQFRLC